MILTQRQSSYGRHGDKQGFTKSAQKRSLTYL